LKDVVHKLLREAPSARLLQNLKKMFPFHDNKELEESDKLKIEDIVQKYFNNLSDYLNEKRTLQDAIRTSTTVLQEFNLGAGDLESRIPNVSFTIVKEIQKELQTARGDDFKQYIYSETIVMIHRLNGAILTDEKYKILLRRLK
jgi:hypothetical protein